MSSTEIDRLKAAAATAVIRAAGRHRGLDAAIDFNERAKELESPADVARVRENMTWQFAEHRHDRRF